MVVDMSEQTKIKTLAECKSALVKLEQILKNASQGDKGFQHIVEGREIVHKQYQPVFSVSRIDEMHAAQFKSFLLFENNRHWAGLHRSGGRMCSNMKKLRAALKILIDEKQEIGERWDAVTGMVGGLGRATMSAILMVAYPHNYGVWNNTSEAALKELGVWPSFGHGASLGHRYATINTLLNQLAKELGIDLWTLDALFWRVKQPASIAGNTSGGSVDLTAAAGEQKFGLEKHLHDFLFDNWAQTALGKEWDLYSEDGDPESAYQFPTDVGQIDLLTKHKKSLRWLVIELKRGQSNDDTVGQVLRYMGWVRKNLAKPKDKVEGLIIARGSDDRLRYAVSEVPQVKVMEYRVDFRLVPAKSVD